MRRLAVAAALVLMGSAGGVLAAPAAQAYPKCAAGYQCVMTFYSDASHSQVIGGFSYSCTGAYYSWGSQGYYQTWTVSACN